MELLFRFDAWILMLLEKFCHWFQKQTGWTNFSLSLPVAIFSTIMTFVDLAKEISQAKEFRLIWIYRYGGAAYFLFQIFRICWIADYSSIRRLANEVANPLKTDRFRWIRLSLLLIMLILDGTYLSLRIFQSDVPVPNFLQASWAGHLALWSLVLCMYLVSCHPLPPCSGKLFDLLKKHFAWVLPASAGTR